jgi:hypothetical protein
MGNALDQVLLLVIGLGVCGFFMSKKKDKIKGKSSDNS